MSRRPLLVSDVARSWIAMAVAMVVIVVVPVSIALLMPRVMAPFDVVRVGYFAAWTTFCTVYILLSVIVFAGMSSAELHRVLAGSFPHGGLRRFWWELNGGGGIWWALTGAGITFVTLLDLAITGAAVPPALVPLSVVVAVAGLALIVVAFAVHYARENAAGGGLVFGGEDPPRFGDYVYLAAQVSTTFGGSDVTTTRTGVRRILAVHGAIAFVFNTVIVALLVSVLVNRIS